MRREIFMENYKKLLEHDPVKEGFTVDVNQFTDWSQEEFDQIFGLKFLREDLKIDNGWSSLESSSGGGGHGRNLQNATNVSSFFARK